MASALTSRLNYYRLTLSCPIIVVVYLVCDNNIISLSFSMYLCNLLYFIQEEMIKSSDTTAIEFLNQMLQVIYTLIILFDVCQVNTAIFHVGLM